MSLETLYFIAQIIAALAIIGSLIFVGLQVRAQTAEQAARRLQDRAGLTSAAAIQVANSPETRAVLMKANRSFSDLTEDEAMIFNSVARQILLLVQTIYQTTPKGRLPDRTAIGPALRVLLSPGMQEYWSVAKSDYGEDFIAFMDRVMAWGKEEGFAPSGLVVSKQAGAEKVKGPHAD